VIDTNKIPQHIAIIMDGNGRWAAKQGMMRVFGHHNGIDAVRDAVSFCVDYKVNYLTLYTFSSENWSRPKLEIDALMTLLMKTMKSETPKLKKSNVRINAIGNLSDLPSGARNTLLNCISDTKDCTGLTLTLALSYSARWELVEAAKQIALKVKNNEISIDAINETMVSQHLTTANIPDPELMIRTSGEHRISNYLLWQMAYTELYFTDVLWPDFRKKDMEQAVMSYQNRERRFGKTSEQVS
jgi:undecaprenyl diphosphate synthase